MTLDICFLRRKRIEQDAVTSCSAGRCYFFLGLGRVWDRALPAAVLLAAPVRPSRRTLDAAEAARGLVCLEFALPIEISFTVDLGF